LHQMKSYSVLFDKSIQSVTKTGLKILQEYPQSRAALMRIMTCIPKATKRRNTLKKQGIVVPPLLIISTTQRCNLQCAGCYAQTHNRDAKNEMTKTQIENLLDQAVDAGCSIILLAGGEPLLCTDWLEAVASYKELLGLVFTNGTLMDDDQADWFADNRNMIPLFSVEGTADKTDERRGQGVAKRIERAMLLLYERSVPFGLSITTGEHNIKAVANREFLLPYMRLGCRLSIFTEYVPVDDSEKLRILTEESRLVLQEFCRRESEREDILLIAFPGNETIFDGCLAAGRGFAHISASGELEPCPFAAYSDRNVLDGSLLDALSSPLLQEIRQKSHLLHEGMGGCALRNQGAAIQALMKSI